MKKIYNSSDSIGFASKVPGVNTLVEVLELEKKWAKVRSETGIHYVSASQLSHIMIREFVVFEMLGSSQLKQLRIYFSNNCSIPNYILQEQLSRLIFTNFQGYVISSIRMTNDLFAEDYYGDISQYIKLL